MPHLLGIEWINRAFKEGASKLAHSKGFAFGKNYAALAGTKFEFLRRRFWARRDIILKLLVLNEMVKDVIISHKNSWEILRISVESSGPVTLREDYLLHAAQISISAFQPVS
jgi:hypothetical protein